MINWRPAASAAFEFLRRAAVIVAQIVAPIARILRTVMLRLFQVLFALILLFEEWGWRPLAAALARLARIPVIARIEGLILGLPPYGALAVFVLPSILIFPLKLVALYLITTGHAVSAALLFIGAKIVGTAVLARLFMLTQPKLMQIGWFARGYNWLMPWKDRAFAAIRASWVWRYGRIVKQKAGNMVRAQWQRWRPQIEKWRAMALAQWRSIFGR